MAINFTWNIKQVDVYPTLEERKVFVVDFTYDVEIN